MARMADSELVQKIYTFTEALSPSPFYPYQEQFAKRVIRSVITNDGEEITALYARQSGKTETIARVTAGLMIILPLLANMPMFAADKRLQMFKRGFWVGIFAPITRQAQLCYNRIRGFLMSEKGRSILEDPDINLEFDTNNGQTVALTNGSHVTAISASDGSNIEGESFMLLILDECQDISNYKIRKSIHPMGAAYNATIVKIGTPTTFKGDFYEAIQRNKEAYEKGRKRKNHFEYNYKVVQKYNPLYAKYIEAEKWRLGEDSDEFQMAYNLKWILERGMFISHETLESLMNSNLGRVFHDKNHVHVAGIDVGKSHDSTVVTVLEVDWENPVIVEHAKNISETEDYVAYHKVLKDWLEIQGDNHEEQYYEIMDFLKNFNLARVVVDGTGMGSPVADRLAANLDCEVIPYVLNMASKSDLYKHLNTEIKAKRIEIPGDDGTRDSIEFRHFQQQMEDLQKYYSGSHMVVHHPDEKDAHDDYPDSLALACWAAKDPGVSRPETTRNPFIKKDPIYRAYYQVRNARTARRR